ncbi:MAG: epoxyqueuosine reductase QueH [Acholeplasmatales bacterium]|nr:epoxyqueuosine reductase QueH [Acholeplasmatales bacterium]
MLENYKEFKEFLNNLTTKPTLLLHTCCAPCSTHTLKVLIPYFNITVFYSNDNISPESEYNERLRVEEEYCKSLGIKVIHDDYNFKDYLEAIKGHEHDGERSQRCYLCYLERLKKTCLKAKELGFDYFTTSLSISPYKVSRWINEIGYQLEKEYNVKYLYSDFKKEEGYKDSIKMSEEANMYRQDYCGCPFSLEERKEAIKKKELGD